MKSLCLFSWMKWIVNKSNAENPSLKECSSKVVFHAQKAALQNVQNGNTEKFAFGIL